MRYIVYSRTSTEIQKDNTSAYQQELDSRVYGDRQGWQFVETIYDNSTGVNLERAGVHRVEELLRHGKADVVVFSKVNRIARGSKAFEEFFERIYLSGGKLAIAELNTVYSSLVEALKGTLLHRAIAEYDHLDIKDKTQKGKLRVIERNGWMHRPIYGYTLMRKPVDGLMVKLPQIVPDQAAIVKFITQQMIEHRNVNAIVRRLNEMDVVTRAMKPQWHGNPVRVILRHVEHYAGKPFTKSYTVADETFTLHYRYPAILDAETVVAVQKAMQLTKWKKPVESKTRPLTGSLSCSRCG